MTIRPLALVLLAALATPAAAQTYSKTEVYTYHDNSTIWVLGQTASVSCVSSYPVSEACDGDVVEATGFDPTYAVPVTQSSFGRVINTITYDTTSTVASGQRGTLMTVMDAGGHTTTLSNWKRGIPQRMDYADATYETAVVDDTGSVTSVTDELRNATSFQYDEMGRLTAVTYPTEAGGASWSVSQRKFVRSATAAYGLPVGHWQEELTTGSGKKITYFDAFWRPVLVRQYDEANPTGTQSFVKSTYDSSGKVTFQSYPSSSSTPTTGVWTSYDALGRVTSVGQDTELTPSLQVTATTYNTGFTTTVTNPRGFSTTTSFQAYDQPRTDWPRTINAPEGVTTDIPRDPFGKPESITRSGTYAGSPLSATRRYVYDAYQRLCQTIEPESGTTIVAYTADDLIDWSADGQVSSSNPNGQTCQIDRDGTALAARINRTYDPRHRELTRSTVSGVENVTTTYYADGQVNTVTAANPGTNPVSTTYTYNKRRLLTREVLQHNASTAWTFDYAYNANGHLSSQTYPGSLVVGYAPDALGRPTQAGTFATGVTYYPNGAIAGFTYGNGIVHTMTQNARQLPARSLDSYGNGGNTTKVLDDSFSYDGNGNVLSLTDASNAPTADNRSWGVLAGTVYDGLDRLVSVRSTNQWGALTGNYNAIYSYDPLDNLRTNRLGASQLNYTYDTSNRLTQLSNGLGGNWAITSDTRGNVTANALKAQAYQFDLAHRMNAVTGKESYLYDGHGRRARTLNLTTGTIEYYGYGKDGRLLQDWSNRRQVRNGYVYLGNTVVGLYEVNLTNGTVTPKYQHTDALGSPVVTTNASKTVLSRMSYTPYGLPTLPMDGVGYTGHFMDVGTQLTYMQQRYYDAQLGRFLSVDAVCADEQSGSNFNRYWYASGNPYRFKDPDGRYVCNTEADCEAARAGLSAINAALRNQHTPTEYAILKAARDFYGEEGEDNGVLVQTGAEDKAVTLPDQSAKDGLKTTITINSDGAKAYEAATKKSSISYGQYVGETMVHEGVHGATQRARRIMTMIKTELRAGEVDAYSAQARFDHAARINPWGYLSKDGSLDADAIGRAADRSVTKTCAVEGVVCK
jgi:RHS repeat-associated protein